MKKKSIFNGNHFLTDGGLETTMIFHEGIEPSEFAVFECLNDHKGRKTLRKYFRSYLQIAEQYNINFVLEAPTWRSNAD